MEQRFVSVWFRHLMTDWYTRHRPDLKGVPFVLRSQDHGRMIIASVNAVAHSRGISVGASVADARAVVPDLKVLDYDRDMQERLLTKLAHWCIRFTPIIGLDPPDGLLLDATGCPHLWGGEAAYLAEINRKFTSLGYDVRSSMAHTVGLAWGLARYSRSPLIVSSVDLLSAVAPLPPEALRIQPEASAILHRLGLHQVGQFMKMPKNSLLRRFGPDFISQLEKAIGLQTEIIIPVVPIEPYEERLPCMEPVVTRAGIAIAMEQLLERLCIRLQQEQKGIRRAEFKCLRVDNREVKILIGTSRASRSVRHLAGLFEVNLSSIEPALGIELFSIVATSVEDLVPEQEALWEVSAGIDNPKLAELLDRITSRGARSIRRYLPVEHYWPERSVRPVESLKEKPTTPWRTIPRPIQLLNVPEAIEVTAPIPDYPPMLFRRKGRVHTIIRADGPERIEQEWWISDGLHRDYYCVEDEEGNRYWLFRLGHYDDIKYQWFIHGVFA